MRGPGAREAVLVFAGAAAGTAARHALSLARPASGGWPVGILVANVTGAFLLGLLVEGLTRGAAGGPAPGPSPDGPVTDRRRDVRLLLGTGVLGGFTTYSALAVDTDLLVHDGRPGTAALYAATTLVAGFAATGLGVAVAAQLRPKRRPA